MQINYKILIFTVIINIFMAISLNSFVSSSVYLSALFLYFLSNLANYWDKGWCYDQNGYRIEKRISYCCIAICGFFVCLHIASSLDFVEFNFQRHNGTYKILLQGVSDSFSTFKSKDITVFVLVSIYIMPIANALLCIIPFCSSHGYTRSSIWKTLSNNKKCCVVNAIISFVLGLVGILVCHIKSCCTANGLGTPQYAKYFFVVLFITLATLFGVLICRKKEKE